MAPLNAEVVSPMLPGETELHRSIAAPRGVTLRYTPAATARKKALSIASCSIARTSQWIKLTPF
jgi:hypothetical protein